MYVCRAMTSRLPGAAAAVSSGARVVRRLHKWRQPLLLCVTCPAASRSASIWPLVAGREISSRRLLLLLLIIIIILLLLLLLDRVHVAGGAFGIFSRARGAAGGGGYVFTRKMFFRGNFYLLEKIAPGRSSGPYRAISIPRIRSEQL